MLCRQGRALAAEIKRMKVEVAEKARAYAQLQAERAAEREEIISLRRQLEDAREEVRQLKPTRPVRVSPQVQHP